MSDDIETTLDGSEAFEQLTRLLDPQAFEASGVQTVLDISQRIASAASQNLPENVRDSIGAAIQVLTPVIQGDQIVGGVTVGGSSTTDQTGLDHALAHEVGSPGRHISPSHYLEKAGMSISESVLDAASEIFPEVVGE